MYQLAGPIRTGWNCRPSKAHSAASATREKSATREVGFFSGSSWRKGTKYRFFRPISAPKLAADPASPSVVEGASKTGRSLRRCAFAAMVTLVSVTPPDRKSVV